MTISSQGIRPLFIGGHRKCGTSLFQRLIDNHPQLNVYPQDLITLYAYFPHFIKIEAKPEERRRRLLDVVFRDMERAFEQDRPVFSAKVRAMRTRFEELIDGIDLTDIGQVLNAQIRAFKDAFNRHRGAFDVLKETSVEIYAKTFLGMYPDSRFIHVIRDPRDNFAALKSGVDSYYSGFGDTESSVLMSMIHRYGIGMKACAMNAARFGPERYHVVRHEDVILRTEEVMRCVADFLSISFDESMLQPTEAGEVLQGNTFESHDMRKVNPVNVNRWRSRITDEEACVIEFFFKDDMRRYGYECAFGEQEQMDAVSNYYAWCNYKYFYYDRFA